MQRESPYEVLVLIASWATLTTLCSVVVRRDERRLSEERLERAWPPAGRDSAVIGLSLLGSPLLALFAVWFHFFRTRSRAFWPPWRVSPVGALVGFAWVVVILVANALVVTGLAWALDLPLE